MYKCVYISKFLHLRPIFLRAFGFAFNFLMGKCAPSETPSSLVQIIIIIKKVLGAWRKGSGRAGFTRDSLPLGLNLGLNRLIRVSGLTITYCFATVINTSLPFSLGR